MTKLKFYLKLLQPLFILVALLWAAHLVNLALGGALSSTFAIEPRKLEGLDGLVGMPFVHVDFDHLIGNTLPLIVLGGLLLLLQPLRFLSVTVIVMLLGGGLLWLLGSSGAHVGASGLVFGWFGYLVAAGFLERSIRAVLGALAAIALYGVTIWAGLTPVTVGGDAVNRVSLEAHVYGLLAGVAAAALLRRRGGASRAIRRPK